MSNLNILIFISSPNSFILFIEYYFLFFFLVSRSRHFINTNMPFAACWPCAICRVMVWRGPYLGSEIAKSGRETSTLYWARKQLDDKITSCLLSYKSSNYTNKDGTKCILTEIWVTSLITGNGIITCPLDTWPPLPCWSSGPCPGLRAGRCRK